MFSIMWWIVPAIIIVLALMMIGLAIKLRPKPTPPKKDDEEDTATQTSTKKPSATPATPAAKPGIRENNLFVGVVSLIMVGVVVELIFPGTFMNLWSSHKDRFGVMIVLILGAFILPAFSPNAKKLAWRAWMICLAMFILFGLGIDWSGVIDWSTNQADAMPTMQDKRDEPVSFVADRERWTRWQTLSSRHGWSFSADGKIEIQEQGHEPFSYDGRGDADVQLVGGLPLRFRSLEKGRVTITFRQ